MAKISPHEWIKTKLDSRIGLSATIKYMDCKGNIATITGILASYDMDGDTVALSGNLFLNFSTTSAMLPIYCFCEIGA
jgi:hypothetical protein